MIRYQETLQAFIAKTVLGRPKFRLGIKSRSSQEEGSQEPNKSLVKESCVSIHELLYPGDLSNPGIEPRSPGLQAECLLSETPDNPKSYHKV